MKRNHVKKYGIFSPKAFTAMSTVSGLDAPNTIMRLSKEQIKKLKGTCECLTENALKAITKFETVTGDVYIARLIDPNGVAVLALDVVRPDYDKKGQCYVMDQEPVYIWDSSIRGDACEAEKIFHFDFKHRTFSVSDYEPLSSCLESKRDIPISIDQISSIDPGIVSTMTWGMKEALSQGGYLASIDECQIPTRIKAEIDGECVKFESKRICEV